jgi:hypothetical protein
MKDVIIKEEVKDETVKKVVVKAMKKDLAKAAFMEDRNAKRLEAKLLPAYSEEEIKALK